MNGNSVLNLKDGESLTYKNYYEKRHGIELQFVREHLLKGRHIFPVQNHLHKYKKRKEQGSWRSNKISSRNNLVDSGYIKDIVFRNIRPFLDPLVSPETLKLQPLKLKLVASYTKSHAQLPIRQKPRNLLQKEGRETGLLSEFYELCRSLDVGRGERYATIEQLPGSFLQSMEEYIREAPRASILRKDLALDALEVILYIDYKKALEKEEIRPPSPSLPPTELEPVRVEAPVQTPDLLGLNNLIPAASALDEKNASANVPVYPANGGTGWELPLVITPNYSDSAAASRRLAGGMDKFRLDNFIR
ncbi:hypothetical protein POM88_022005 [Heracleum sosnowskyi]|uniref:AP180 N-terminal homology (ANTH) domain-containing protein n=1 Tax=Heracleum sosnowskyi TaxID=360622 RepID=A0AAD8MP99_9APIA|nr:hypothetical protein POM88_022005 [Heracleum sosnowskyi]